jgi:hypothetical protein
MRRKELAAAGVKPGDCGRIRTGEGADKIPVDRIDPGAGVTA